MDRILKILKKENGPSASSAPALELNTIIFKHVYWYMQQISGERLQDHWSSGSYFAQCRCDIDLLGVLVKFLKYLPPVHVKCKVNTAIQYYNVMILSTDFQNLC